MNSGVKVTFSFLKFDLISQVLKNQKSFLFNQFFKQSKFLFILKIFCYLFFMILS